MFSRDVWVKIGEAIAYRIPVCGLITFLRGGGGGPSSGDECSANRRVSYTRSGRGRAPHRGEMCDNDMRVRGAAVAQADARVTWIAITSTGGWMLRIESIM